MFQEIRTPNPPPPFPPFVFASESKKVVIAYIAATVTKAFYSMYEFIPQQQKWVIE